MRLTLIVTLALLALALTGPLTARVMAQTAESPAIDAGLAERIATLGEVMQIGPVLDVMREEGIAYGESLATEMLPGGADGRWTAIVDGIYDGAAMKTAFNARFAAELATDPAAIDGVTAFFGSERGQRILTLEIEARRAMLDDAVEEAAKVLMQDMVAGDDPRMELLHTFVESGDLIEMNVVGALNANFAFFQGMAAAGGPAAQMTEQEMLDDVWGREGEVRSTTKEWLYSYFALAYQPLSDADLQAYVDFWKSPDGKKVNGALFAAFDVIFTRISHDLGQAAAVQMQGDDI